MVRSRAIRQRCRTPAHPLDYRSKGAVGEPVTSSTPRPGLSSSCAGLKKLPADSTLGRRSSCYNVEAPRQSLAHSMHQARRPRLRRNVSMHSTPWSRRSAALVKVLWQYRAVWLVVLLALNASCESSTTSEVTTGPTPAKCQLTLAPLPNITATGGTVVVSITAQPECPWEVSTQANWISNLSPATGQGNGTLEFVAAENPVPTMREGELVINDNRVRVMQEAAECRFSIDPEQRTLTSDANATSFTVETHQSCKWTARSTAEWITLTAGVDGAGNGTVAYRVLSNGGGPRTGAVTVGDRTHTIIQQNAATGPSPTPPAPPPLPACTYTISPTNQAIAAAGGPGSTITVTTAAHCGWTATSNVSWMTITSGATGTGNGSVSFTAQLNNSGAPRTGTLTIAGRAYTVSQIDAAPEPCTYEISPSSASLSALGGTGSIRVFARSGCAWTASNDVSWITFPSGRSGNGNGRVDFLVLPNPGSARSSSIAIAEHSFPVSQDGVLPSQ
jgi:Viral BACON domain/Putative binding domain, N-terminal